MKKKNHGIDGMKQKELGERGKEERWAEGMHHQMLRKITSEQFNVNGTILVANSSRKDTCEQCGATDHMRKHNILKFCCFLANDYIMASHLVYQSSA